MGTTTVVRVDNETYVALKQRAEERHISVGQVIADLLDAEKERQFWADVDASYAAMRADPEAWAEELALRRELDGTLMDGLDDE
jgi:hypothetical protein